MDYDTEVFGSIYIVKIKQFDDPASRDLMWAFGYKGQHRVTFGDLQNIIKVNFYLLTK